jgi:hypothetical protein
MSGLPLVLDAAGLEGLCAPRPPDRLRALLAEAHRREREVLASFAPRSLEDRPARVHSRRASPATTLRSASGPPFG